jgi:hypothetical protein
MKICIKARSLMIALGALMFLAFGAVSAAAQCAMCKASVRGAASANPQAVADTLNLAVLVLLIPPVLIFSGLFLVLLRYRRGADDGGATRLKTARAFD